MDIHPIEAWRWWIDGLVDAVLLVEERFRRRRPVRLAPLAGGHVVVHAGGRLGRRVLRPEAGHLAPPRLARALKDRVVDLVVRDEETITRRLGPLPPESRPYVEGIVTHQLERMTPWQANDTLSHHSVETVGADDPRLMVTVTATSKAMHAAAIEAIDALRPKALRLVRGAADGADEVVLPVASADLGTERARIGLTLRLGLAAVAAVTVLGAWWYVSAADDVGSRVSEIEDRLDAHRRRLMPAAGATRSDRDIIAALSRDTPMSVIALENLSAALPDDTYLATLQIGHGRLRMSGVTRDIAALTTTLEATALFTEPVFAAPTVRLARGDRFTLDLRVSGAEGGGR
jgi:general secretion pathway protein L